MSDLHVFENERDFDLQMKSLAAEAEHELDDRDSSRIQACLVAALQPVVAAIEAIGNAVNENAAALQQLREHVTTQQANTMAAPDGVAEKNTLNQRLFDCLHEELRTYKDGFLLEILQRPVACDLITLFDDLSVLHKQTDAFL